MHARLRNSSTRKPPSRTLPTLQRPSEPPVRPTSRYENHSQHAHAAQRTALSAFTNNAGLEQRLFAHQFGLALEDWWHLIELVQDALQKGVIDRAREIVLQEVYGQEPQLPLSFGDGSLVV